MSPPAPVFTLFFVFCRFHAGGTNAKRPDLNDIQPGETNMDTPWLRRLKQVNGELWLLLSLFLIAMLLNYMVSMHRVVLGFYVLPTIFSAYFYGRRHATLTAVASLCLLVIVKCLHPRGVHA